MNSNSTKSSKSLLHESIEKMIEASLKEYTIVYYISILCSNNNLYQITN